MGWAVITHPFHPLRGDRFRILKARKWAGRPTLILEGGYAGTFAVPREWTDRDPAGGVQEGGTILAPSALLELVALSESLKGQMEKD